MADRAPRVTVPTNFNPLDSDTYEPGTPTSSWLGRELGRNQRWLDKHLTRRLGEAFAQNIDNLDTPTVRNAGGEVLGPWSHWGTPGVREGEWYVRLSLALNAEVTIAPFVISPDIMKIHAPYEDGRNGEVTFIGTGAAANYGPITTSLLEGLCRVGLLVVPEMEAANDDTGSVEFCDGPLLCSTAGDFNALTPPFPLIAIGDGASQLSQWTQILAVSQTLVAGDTVRTQDRLTPPGKVYGSTDKPGKVWATRYAETVTVLSVYLRETH